MESNSVICFAKCFAIRWASVLKVWHDESTLLFDTLSDDVHQKDLPGVHSVVMVLSCGE